MIASVGMAFSTVLTASGLERDTLTGNGVERDILTGSGVEQDTLTAEVANDKTQQKVERKRSRQEKEQTRTKKPATFLCDVKERTSSKKLKSALIIRLIDSMICGRSNAIEYSLVNTPSAIKTFRITRRNLSARDGSSLA